MTAYHGIILWKVVGNPVEEFIGAICRISLPGLEEQVRRLSNGLIDGADPCHGGIKVRAIRTGVGPLRYEYHAERDSMFLEESA